MKRPLPAQIPALLLLATALSGCGSVGRLQMVGKAPKFTAPEPLDIPSLEPSLASQGREAGRGVLSVAPPSARAAAPPAQSASLFRSGAGALFRDLRASQIGDILTVRINIADKADVGNATSRSRTGSENSSLTALLGFTNPVSKLISAADGAGKLAGLDSTSKNGGTGTVTRSETINMTIAALVTGVLPNGNLMIRGRQEVRVNFEMRELIVTGVVRPEDIARDNSILHTQIAEARISYGGHGQLTDAQQARWGQQIYDALFPF